jgi:hypothetical protein
MDGQDYYESLFSSFDDQKKKKKPSFLETLEEAQKLDPTSPNYRENIAKARGLESFGGAPAQNWVPKDMAQAFKKAIELSDDPVETEVRLNTAYYLSQKENIPFDEAFRNMDDILNADYKKAMSPESGLQAIKDTFKTQLISRMIFPLSYELKDKLLRGKYSTWEQVESDPLYKKIQDYEKKMPPEDVIKRSAGVNFLKNVVQVVPSFVESAVVGALVGTAAYATAGAALPALSAALPSVFGMGSAMLSGGALVSTIPTIASMFGAVTGAAAVTSDMRQMEGGSAFYDMMKFRDPTTGARYNPAIAATASTWYEGVSNAIELFQAGELLEPFSDFLTKAQVNAVRDSIKASISSVADASARAGGFLKAINSTMGKFLYEWASGTVEESLQETAQEGMQAFFEEVAKTWTNRLEGTSIAPATRQEIQKRLVDTFVSSMEGMGVTELIPSGVKIFRDTREEAHEAVADALWDKIKDATTPGERAEAQSSQNSQNNQDEGLKNKGEPILFKSYEPSPGIIEVRGTLDTEGTTRKPSVILNAKIDDDAKSVTIGSILVSSKLRDSPNEAVRQATEAVQYLAGELDGYRFSMNSKSELSRRVASSLGDVFTEPKVQENDSLKEAENSKNPASVELEVPNGSNLSSKPEKTSPSQSNEELEEGAVEPREEKAGSEQFREEDTSLGNLQTQGAMKVESSFDNSYRYSIDNSFPLDKIEFSNELPNFKEGANKQGVVEALQGQPEPMGMPPIVIYQTEDGHNYIVTGRHRLDLWRRNGLKNIPAHIIKQSDGYSMSDMAIIDAEMNIRDNQGKESDYVRYFAHTGYTHETAERRGLLRTHKGQLGYNIGTLASPSLQALYYAGKITGEKASAIASAAPNDAEMQAVGIRLAADKNNTPESIHNALTLFAQTKRGESSQEDLFGMNDDEVLAQQLKISKAAESIKDDIKAELGVLKQALRLGDKDRLRFIEKYGYKIGDRDSIAHRMEELSSLSTRWEAWAQDPELFAQARAKANGEPAIVSERNQEYNIEPFDEKRKTDTSEFKKWFDGSSVVDDEGKPLVVYHGTRSTPYDANGVEQTFDRFNIKHSEFGAHFGSSEQANAILGDVFPNEYLKERIYPVYLNIKNPLRLEDHGRFTVDEVASQARDLGVISREKFLEIHELAEGALYDRQKYYDATETLRNAIKDAGYDGIVYLNRREGADFFGKDGVDSSELDAMTDDEVRERFPDARDSWIAFEPTQIKSIFNRGSWDLNDPRIFYEKSVEYNAPQNENGWVYKSAATVTNKMQGPMSGRQVLKMLQASGVRTDELAWTGLNTSLDTDKKLSPTEVLDIINSHRIDIHEITKGGVNALVSYDMVLDAERRGDFDEAERLNRLYDDQQLGQNTGTGNETKFASYTIPGGENYRELLLTLPEIKTSKSYQQWLKENFTGIDTEDARRLYQEQLEPHKNFQSLHWDETNVLAHTRIDDRTTSDGKKMLFVEEIQSDWHQEGRKKGYGESGVPLAPFSKTWHELVFKRLLRMAVEGGYDTIAWTTGEQQTERYNLSHQVRRLSLISNGKDSGTYNLVIEGADGQELREYSHSGKRVTPQELENLIGKESAKNMIAGANAKAGPTHQTSEWYDSSPEDLKVGGEGMKGFYDKILVDFANTYTKKWGTSVGESQLDVGNGKTETVHILPITDSMRASVEEGQYLFDRAGETYGVTTDKAQYRQQMLKARELSNLIASNVGNFFNDEIEQFVIKNNQAIIKALEDAKTDNVSFSTTSTDEVNATLTPSVDGKKLWDLNFYKDGELVTTERFKNRTDAIIALYIDTAPAFGGAETWSVSGAQPELFDQITPNQQGDLFEASELHDEPVDYDEKTIKLVYGSQEAFDEANRAIQLSLFGDDEEAAGDLFASTGDQEGTTKQGKREPGNTRRNSPAVSSVFGTEGHLDYPAFAENRKRPRRVSFVGQHVEGASDIARLFQVYRNSQVESFHLIYTDENGNILAHNAMSSGVPGRTIAVENPTIEWDKRAKILNDRIKRLNASKVYLLHNHPSGNPTPSSDDIMVTLKYIQAIGDKLGGHVVIDHGVASFITKQDYLDYVSKRDSMSGNLNNLFLAPWSFEEISTLIPKIEYTPNPGSYNLKDIQAFTVTSTKTLAYVASELINEDVKTALIITDSQYRVITWSRLNSTDPKVVYQMVKENGGVHAFIATDDQYKFDELVIRHKAASLHGGKYQVLTDMVYIPAGDDWHNFKSFTAYQNLRTHYDYKINRANQKARNYVFELADDAAEFDSYDEFRKTYLKNGENESELKAAWSESQKKKAGTPEEFTQRLYNDRALFKNFLEANGADLFDKKVDKKHLGIVDAASYRLATGGVVPESTLNRALLLISKNPKKWLDRFNELSGGQAGDGRDFEIESKGKNLDTLIAEYHDALAKLPQKQRETILSSTEPGTGEVIGTLRLAYEKSKKELEDYRGHLSYGEKQIIDMTREAKKLDREIWALRSKAKLSEVNRAQLHEKESMQREIERMIQERTNALSPQSGLKNAAYLAKKEAYRQAKTELASQIAIEKARKAERALKLYYGQKITRRIAKNIDFKVAQQIMELQQKIDPHFREGDSMGTSARPLNKWSLDELQRFYEQVEDLREYGRGVYAERQSVNTARRSEIRNALLDSISKNGTPRPSYYHGTNEQREQSYSDRNIFKDFDLSLETVHRIARELDGGKEGPFYQNLVEREREAYRKEKFSYDKRVNAFDAEMKSLGLDRDTMYREKVRLGDQTISKWEAIALYVGSKNPRTERAFVYGNMMSQEERDSLSDEAFTQRALENRNKIKQAIEQLSPKEIQLADWLIQEGVQNYDRLAEVTYQLENRIPAKEESYYPHERVMRSGETETSQDAALEALAKAGKPARGVSKQPTKNRVDIPDRKQSPISLDAYQVFHRGWERQEHLISYAQFITDMNAILKRGPGTALLREKIRLNYGQGPLDYIDRWIAEAANPKAFSDFNKTVRGFERVFKMMRGPLGIAYLGFRVSRGVFQLITSPAPYLPYAGEYMVRRMVMDLNPAEYMKTLSFAEENSAFIRHRVINPVDAYIKEHIEKLPSKLQRGYYEAAGAIMQFSDLWSVSTGWMAVYEKTAAQLKKAGKMSAEDIHSAAVKEADKVTIETQPTYRSQDLAPAFKQDSETWRFLLQFQTPLNVIYNQLFHDTSSDWKSGNKLRAIGIVTGYLSVMGLMALMTAPKDDDDDSEKKARYFLSGVATAPLEAIPLIGSVAAGLVGSEITGERYWRDDEIFPGVAKLVQGASRVMSADDEEKAKAAYLQLLEGAGMLVGAPTSAVKEYYRALWQGDWGALLGQRKQ